MKIGVFSFVQLVSSCDVCLLLGSYTVVVGRYPGPAGLARERDRVVKLDSGQNEIEEGEVTSGYLNFGSFRAGFCCNGGT